MNLWEEIEQLDQRIMDDKQKLKILMEERKKLHGGFHHLKEEPVTKSIVERSQNDKFIPPTQEEIAQTRRAYDAQFPIRNKEG